MPSLIAGRPTVSAEVSVEALVAAIMSRSSGRPAIDCFSSTLVPLAQEAATGGLGAGGIVSLVLSGIAAFVAFVAAAWAKSSSTKANRLQAEANDLQQRIVAIEEAREAERVEESQKARLVGRLIHEVSVGRAHSYTLRIENRGHGKASGITIELDGRPAAEHPTFPDQPILTELAGLGTHQYTMHKSYAHPDPGRLRIVWEDAAGSGEWDSEVSYETVML